MAAPTEYNAALENRLDGGEAGDIIACRPFDISLELFEAGQLQAVDDLEGMDAFGEVARSGWVTDDGEQSYCVPMASVIHGFYYNRDVFDDLALEPPEPMEDFHTVLDTVAAEGDTTPIAQGTVDQWDIAEVDYTGIGPNYWNGEERRQAPIDGTARFTDPQFVAPFGELATWGRYMPDGYEALSYDDAKVLFTNGEGAIFPGGSWEIMGFEQNASFEIGVFQPPLPEAGKQCYISDHVDIGMGMNADTEHRRGSDIPGPSGWPQEFQSVFAAYDRRADQPGPPQYSFAKADRRVSVFYFYVWDDDFGPGFIKICSYFPYPAKVWVNGHEWTKRQAIKAGIGFEELANGFAAVDDPDRLQAICDRLGPADIEAFFDRWIAQIPTPLGDDDRGAGYWWELSMRQVEVLRTIVFDAPRRGRAFLEAVVADNIGIGRPSEVRVIFNRRIRKDTKGTFRTRVVTRGVDVCVDINYRDSRIKQYLKEGWALRIETVVNSPDDLGVKRRLVNLDELQAKARAVNARLLATPESRPELCHLDTAPARAVLTTRAGL